MIFVLKRAACAVGIVVVVFAFSGCCALVTESPAGVTSESTTEITYKCKRCGEEETQIDALVAPTCCDKLMDRPK